MQILVDGKPAVIDAGSSFEFIIENHQFETTDGYTFSITFPLRGCQQNQEVFGWLNLPFVKKPVNRLPCTISCGKFYEQGSLSIMEVTEAVVKGQFLQNVPPEEEDEEDILETTYINEINLGSQGETNPSRCSPSQALRGMSNAVALPWAPEGYDIINNYAIDGQWAETTERLTWQWRLDNFVWEIAYSVGYDIEFWDEFITENPKWGQAIVCNTLPPTWEMPDFQHVLPHWTVKEFFEKLAKFVGAEFTFDRINKKISFHSMKQLMDKAGTFEVKEVADQYTAKISRDEADADFLPSKKYKYKDAPFEVWKYLCCPEFMRTLPESAIKRYKTIEEMRNDAAYWLKWRNSLSGRRGSIVEKVLYVESVDTYFAIRYHVVDSEGRGISSEDYPFAKFGELQPLNVFGPKDYDPNADYEELEFVPVCVDWTMETKCMLIPVEELEEDAEKEMLEGEDWNSGMDIFQYFISKNSNIWQSRTLQQLANEKASESAEYFDRIYIGFLPGHPQNVYEYPVTDTIVNEWGFITVMPDLMRLSNGSVGYNSGREIEPKVSYSFSFISEEIPDVRAIFLIHGQKFACRKLTLTFKQNGLSKLIKGEFYRIKE